MIFTITPSTSTQSSCWLLPNKATKMNKRKRRDRRVTPLFLYNSLPLRGRWHGIAVTERGYKAIDIWAVT